MSLEFQAPKGQRMHRYFWCATVWDSLEPSLWWVDEVNAFVPCKSEPYLKYGASSNSKPIRTLRAFKRFLRKHPELKGRTVRLVNRYVGYDVEAKP